MKVVCINDRWVRTGPNCEGAYMPKIGDELTVTGTHTDWGGTYYLFAETQSGIGYLSTHFVPIDSITEDAEVLEIEIEIETVNV